jgi:hypothetical protein
MESKASSANLTFSEASHQHILLTALTIEAEELKMQLQDDEDLTSVHQLPLLHRVKKLREIVHSYRGQMNTRSNQLEGMKKAAEEIKKGKNFIESLRSV